MSDLTLFAVTHRRSPHSLAGLDHPLLTLFSPQFLHQGQQIYAQLRAGGYTELVVYLAQQIQQFQQRGAEFAMQHLGTEDELKRILLDLQATLTPEERLAGLPSEKRLQGLSPEERLVGLSPEERLRGLTLAERERLRLLLQQPPPKESDDSSAK
jgi:hypothetical protein